MLIKISFHYIFSYRIFLFLSTDHCQLISGAKIKSKKTNFQIFFKYILLIFNKLNFKLSNRILVRFSTDTLNFTNDCLSSGYSFPIISAAIYYASNIFLFIFIFFRFCHTVSVPFFNFNCFYFHFEHKKSALLDKRTL